MLDFFSILIVTLYFFWGPVTGQVLTLVPTLGSEKLGATFYVAGPQQMVNQIRVWVVRYV